MTHEQVLNWLAEDTGTAAPDSTEPGAPHALHETRRGSSLGGGRRPWRPACNKMHRHHSPQLSRRRCQQSLRIGTSSLYGRWNDGRPRIVRHELRAMGLFARKSSAAKQLDEVARVLHRHAWEEAVGLAPSGSFDEVLPTAHSEATDALREIRRREGDEAASRKVRKLKKSLLFRFKETITTVTHATAMTREQGFKRTQPFIRSIEQMLDQALIAASEDRD